MSSQARKSKRGSVPRSGYRPFSDFNTSPASPAGSGGKNRESTTFSWLEGVIAPDPDSPTTSRSTSNSARQVAKETTEDSTMTRTKKSKSAKKSKEAPHQPATLSPAEKVRTRGHGSHDNSLAQAKGVYREPSLRRRGGISIVTPKMIRVETEKRKKVQDAANSVQAIIPPVVTSDAAASDLPPLPQGCEWQTDLPKRQRGDIQPQVTRSVLPIKPQGPAPFSVFEKMETLKFCLTYRDEYVNNYVGDNDEITFWQMIWRQLPLSSAVFRNFARKAPKHLRQAVSDWCNARRKRLGEDRPPRSDSDRSDLDKVIDEWNLAFAQRFCNLNWGLIMAGMSETIVAKVKTKMQPEFSSYVQTGIRDFINTSLNTRREELEALKRVPQLRSNSGLEEYHAHISLLQERIKERGHNSFIIRESKTLMSLVADLQPGLDQIVREQLQSTTTASEPSISTAPEGTIKNSVNVAGGANDLGTDEAGPDDTHDTSDDDANTDQDADDEENDHDEAQAISDTILPSIEPRTPVVSPRVMIKLLDLEDQFRQSQGIVLGREKSGRKSKKRKNPPVGDEDLEEFSTPLKQPRIGIEEQVPGSPGSNASTWSFPSIDNLIIRPQAGPSLKPKPREVSPSHHVPGAITPPSSEPNLLTTPVPPSVRATRKTPDHPSRKSRSKKNKPTSSDEENQQGALQGKPSLFRESTVDFRGMTPNARGELLYRTVKELVKVCGVYNPPGSRTKGSGKVNRRRDDC